MIDKHRVKKNFSNAKNYDNFTSYHNLTLAMISRTIKNFFANYSAQNGNCNKKCAMNILDIGCGTAQGYFAVKDALPTGSFNYFGLDFAIGLLNEAGRKLKLSNKKALASNTYLICGDAESLPLKYKKFDVVFSNMTVHWLNNIDIFLNKCNYILKDGGVIILSFLISGTLRELEENFKSEYIKLHTFPELEYINGKINKTGLKIEYSEILEYIETAESSAQLLKRINMLGAKNAVNGKTRGTALLRQGMINYDKYYRDSNNMVYSTYKIAYLILKK
ncbi:MAG: methyltransferase domain-containing protein [bacterium]